MREKQQKRVLLYGEDSMGHCILIGDLIPV